MDLNSRGAITIVLVSALLAISANAQAPREYLNAPIGTNYVEIGYANTTSNTTFDPTIVVGSSVNSDINIGYARYGRWGKALRGQFGAAGVIVPYVGGIDVSIKNTNRGVGVRSFGDSQILAGMALYGAPALELKDFPKYKLKHYMGSTLYVYVPTGAYKADRLINIGTNRWTFKPDIHGGWQIRRGTVFEWIAQASFFTENNSFLGNKTYHQNPLGTLYLYLSQNFTPKLFAAFTSAWTNGGNIKINGVKQGRYQNKVDLGFEVNYDFNTRHHAKVFFTKTATSRTNNNPNLRTWRFAYYITWW